MNHNSRNRNKIESITIKVYFLFNKVIGVIKSAQSTLRKIHQAAQKTPGMSSDQTHTYGFGLKLFFRSFDIPHDNSNDRQHGNAVSLTELHNCMFNDEKLVKIEAERDQHLGNKSFHEINTYEKWYHYLEY